jgi:hypothetical protein
MRLPIVQIKRGLSPDDDSPWLCVSVIASPGWFYAAGALAFIVALAALK